MTRSEHETKNHENEKRVVKPSHKLENTRDTTTHSADEDVKEEDVEDEHKSGLIIIFALRTLSILT
jgi:hypothetical protein